jgi:phosphoglycerol transferase MdoB-like AlkP superfamily enzyme
LEVPAWGANTVRTEFAFLSGIGENELGVHRFNPYRAIAAGWNVLSLASYLKRLNYRTVCIHPYPASFYRRDRVCPRLCFDEFLDVRAFDDAMRYGPYIGDGAVADKIEAVLLEASVPTFIFAITMENHGPLHLERIKPSDIDELYIRPPPAGCDDLTIYLRHLRNADRMISRLRQTLEQCERPASLCWFGDHVPIMPAVYEIFGAPHGEVEYVLWNRQWTGCPAERKTHVHDLALDWLRIAGVASGGVSALPP